MDEKGQIPENEAKKLVYLGAKLAKDDGGVLPSNFYPVFDKNRSEPKHIGYGFTYRMENLAQDETEEVLGMLSRWLKEEYTFAVSRIASRYHNPQGEMARKKNAVRLWNRDSGRRVEMYLIPDRLPPKRTISFDDALKSAIAAELTSNAPLTIPFPWKQNIFYEKELGYCLEDFLKCRDYTLEVRVEDGMWLDYVSTPMGVGEIVGARKMETKERRFAKTLKALLLEKFEKVGWDAIGGMEDIKKEIQFDVLAPMLYPELYKSIDKPVPNTLLVGPPGTGKTLIFKVLVSEAGNSNIVPFRPEYIAPFVGRDEAGIGALFDLCDRMTEETGQHTILLWDEMEDVGSRFDIARDKVTNAMLRLLGGMETYKFSLFGSTNRPQDFDPALLRKGRMDKLVYVGPPYHAADRLKILELYTKSLNLASDVNLKNIADETKYFTGADLEGLCKSAMRRAPRRVAKETIDRLANLNKDDVKITMDDFKYVLKTDGSRTVELNKKWIESFSDWSKKYDISIDLEKNLFVV